MSAGDPLDTGYRRLRSCRYADDVAIGIIGPQDDARHVLDHVTCLLKEQLHLQTAVEKSGIYHAMEGLRFLGYDVRTYTGNRLRKVKRRDSAYTTLSRTVAKDGQLHVPMEKVRQCCQRKGYGDFGRLRPLHKPEWLVRSDVEIIHAYNAAFRGFATSYSLATKVKQTLNRLEYLWTGSLLKTLANTHKTTVGTTSKKLTQGRDDVYHDRVNGRKRQLTLDAVKDLKRPAKSWAMLDAERHVAPYT
jgi:hypothetical protein